MGHQCSPGPSSRTGSGHLAYKGKCREKCWKASRLKGHCTGTDSDTLSGESSLDEEQQLLEGWGISSESAFLACAITGQVLHLTCWGWKLEHPQEAPPLSWCMNTNNPPDLHLPWKFQDKVLDGYYVDRYALLKSEGKPRKEVPKRDKKVAIKSSVEHASELAEELYRLHGPSGCGLPQVGLAPH